MHGPHDSPRAERVTLPPIRDLFRDELSRPLSSRPGTAENDSTLNEHSSALKAVTYGQHSPLFSPPHHQQRDVVFMHNNSSPRSLKPQHRTTASGGRQFFHRLDDELPQTRTSPVLWADAIDQKPRRASDGMQHSGYHVPYPPHDTSNPYGPWHMSSGFPFDDKQQAMKGRQPLSRPSSSDGSSNGKPAPAKYDCPYCGKGFNRPSSLKIHINSHTGEKPFICPMEGCGRSFSVLSNMRRHARMHTQGSLRDPESI